MPTHYAGHDNVYRRRRAEGRTGWETSDVVHATCKELAEALSGSYAPQGGTALELGCGAGDLSLFVARRGFAVTGIDIAPYAIAWAREKAAAQNISADFRVADVRDLSDLPSNHFDLILDGNCLHCIIGEADRKAFLQNAFRVLKPETGLLHIRTMSGPPKGGLQEGFDATTRCQMAGGFALRYIGLPEAIQQEVEDAGFDLLCVEYRTYPTPDAADMLFIDAVKHSETRIQ